MVPNGEIKKFHFDHVFNINDSQDEAYEMITHPIKESDTTTWTIVEESFEGYNSCIMAYGQTGSGKTHTIFGSLEAIENLDYEISEEVGVVPRLVDGIFDHIQENTKKK